MNDVLVIAVPVALVVLGAAIAILKIVAPKTKTEADDKALNILEKVEDVVEDVTDGDE